MRIPTRPVHFIGIGGDGLSGVAQILHESGVSNVSGCDAKSNIKIERLKRLGIKINMGSHDTCQITEEETQLVICSSNDNTEILNRRGQLAMPLLYRVEILNEIIASKSKAIAIGGTHGKSTTTALIGTLLSMASMEPTIYEGGIMNNFGSNAVTGNGQWIVFEADESDGSFVTTPPANIVVALNIDTDHLDYFKTEEALVTGFKEFVEHVTGSGSSDGAAILCADCPRLNKLIRVWTDEVPGSKILTYGLHNSDDFVDVRGKNVRFTDSGMMFDVELRGGRFWTDMVLKSIIGEHNVLNSLAVIAVGLELGISEKMIRGTLREYSGVQRRFQLTGIWNNVKIYSDFAHHPTEVSAVLKSAREICKGKLIAVHQPYRNSRFETKIVYQEYINCFNDADEVILLPVYNIWSGERGYSTMGLGDEIRNNNTNQFVLNFETFVDIPAHFSKTVKSEDMIVCMGAGSIHEFAIDLPKSLENFYQKII